jgi:hypothetical protein
MSSPPTTPPDFDYSEEDNFADDTDFDVRLGTIIRGTSFGFKHIQTLESTATFVATKILDHYPHWTTPGAKHRLHASLTKGGDHMRWTLEIFNVEAPWFYKSKLPICINEDGTDSTIIMTQTMINATEWHYVGSVTIEPQYFSDANINAD